MLLFYHFQDDLDAVVGMCSGSFSQNLVTSQYPTTESQSQIGENVLALCTGQFYDNQFVSQLDSNSQDEDNGNVVPQNDVTESIVLKDIIDNPTTENDNLTEINNVKMYDNSESIEDNDVTNITEELDVPKDKENQTKVEENTLLKSLLDELNEPELTSVKPHNFFANNDNHGKENTQNVANIQFKKKFIIDSDDEENNGEGGIKKRKKTKKKKLELRALQLSGNYSYFIVIYLLTNVFMHNKRIILQDNIEKNRHLKL